MRRESFVRPARVSYIPGRWRCDGGLRGLVRSDEEEKGVLGAPIFYSHRFSVYYLLHTDTDYGCRFSRLFRAVYLYIYTRVCIG